MSSREFEMVPQDAQSRLSKFCNFGISSYLCERGSRAKVSIIEHTFWLICWELLFQLEECSVGAFTPTRLGRKFYSNQRSARYSEAWWLSYSRMISIHQSKGKNQQLGLALICMSENLDLYACLVDVQRTNSLQSEFDGVALKLATRR